MRIRAGVLGPRVRMASLGSMVMLLSWPSVAAQHTAQLDIDITRSSIEQLLDVKITSVSKKAEPITHAAAAVFVLTAEDIRRSGATTIPDALRLVPGVNVARIDANKWAVSIRGFNSRTANKLLVLVDGRSIYDLLFTGTLWEAKDVMLEDVERIEVVRGPGGTLWGANAVNGVINIITKHAKDTQGGLAVAGAGTEEKGFARLRYGTHLGGEHYLRFYGKLEARDEGYLEDGADDDSQRGQGGFRYDGEFGERDALTFQGDVYRGTFGTADESTSPDTEASGFNLLGRWMRDLDRGGRISLLGYYDHTTLDSPALGEDRDTLELEFQHQLAGHGRHQVTWGANYRLSRDDIDNSPVLQLEPDHQTERLLGIYAQDEIELLPERVFLTLGAKWEDNDHTGSEFMPNARVAWRINSSNVLWAAVSRAVRVPSRLEEDFVIPLGGGVTFSGSDELEAETLTAYESGLRFQPSETTYIDLALFFNDYDNLFTIEGLTAGNKSSARTHGAELAVTYIPSERWQLSGGYSYLHMNVELDSDSAADPSTPSDIAGSSPQHQAFLRLGTGWGDGYRFDAALRYVDELPTQDVPAYLVADLRLARRWNRTWETALIARNLLDDRHPEQRSNASTEVQHGVYLSVARGF